MQTRKELREKIHALETERARLIVEIDGLRKTAEARVVALESEVGQMREEAKNLRELVGDGGNPKDPAANSPKIQILPSSN